jgi:hypothetical protein
MFRYSAELKVEIVRNTELLVELPFNTISPVPTRFRIDDTEPALKVKRFEF